MNTAKTGTESFACITARVELQGTTPNAIGFTTVLDDAFNVSIACDSDWIMIISINEPNIPKLNLRITADNINPITGCNWTPASSNTVPNFEFYYEIYSVKIDLILGGGGIAMVGTISTRS